MIGRVLALARKELRQLFASPIAYVVGTAYVALTGIYFFQHLVGYNQLLFVYQSEGIGAGGFDQGTVPSHINVLNEVFVPAADDFGLFLLVVLPLVTMRVFAEERASGTDELLLTSGLRPWEVALAKHAVTYLFVVLLLAASAIYPAVVPPAPTCGGRAIFRSIREDGSAMSDLEGRAPVVGTCAHCGCALNYASTKKDGDWFCCGACAGSDRCSCVQAGAPRREGG